MLRHWLVRNGHHVEDQVCYIKTNDELPECQLEQVCIDVLGRGWKLEDVYVIEKATTHEHRTLKQLILESLQ